MRKFSCGLIVVVFLVCSLGTAHAGTPGTLKWSYATGDNIFSSPAIGADGTVYVGSMDGKLYAINPDGTLKWAYITGNWIESSPAIGADGTIYVGSTDQKLYAINPDGTLKWSYATGDYTICSPAIGADGTIYMGSMDGQLYAINPDGTLKWSYATGDVQFSSPAIGADGTVYVGSMDGKLYAINPDGTLKWAYVTGDYIVCSPAIGADGTVYMRSDNSDLYAINPDGTLKWSYGMGGENISSPAIGVDGTIYVGSWNGELYAINPDGTFKWSYPTVSQEIWSSPAVGANGTVYVGSTDGELYAINPDGTLKWSYITVTGGIINSSPAIAPDGTIYVGSTDYNLYAVYSSSPGLANSPWPMFRHNLNHTARVFVPTLTVTRSGTGTGTVTSLPSGIDCGTTCSASYPIGTLITLTAIPDAGFTFAGWSGGCGGVASCKVTIGSDVTVKANFTAPNPCTYSIFPAGKAFSHTGGSINVMVLATGAKTCANPALAVSAPWIEAELVFFKHNHGAVRISARTNTTTSPRQGTATIGSKTFTVREAGMPCGITSITPHGNTFTSSGGSASFSVTAPNGCSWGARVGPGSASWLTISSGAAGNGNGSVTYAAQPNTNRRPRSGMIYVYPTRSPMHGKVFTLMTR